MTSEKLTRKIPEVALVEGIDFIDGEQLLERVVTELKELGISPDEVLLCGYDDAESDNPEPRRTTFAYTVEEVRRILDSPQHGEDTPFEYAFDSYPHGSPTVAAYNADDFDHEPSEEYVLKPEATIGSATLALFRLSS